MQAQSLTVAGNSPVGGADKRREAIVNYYSLSKKEKGNMKKTGRKIFVLYYMLRNGCLNSMQPSDNQRVKGSKHSKNNTAMVA